MVAYLDHAATTPIRPEARRAMLALMSEPGFGNPSGAHSVARAARRAVEDAREVVAAALGAEPSQVVFTGGGTESDNLAVAGRSPRGHILCSAVEHDAVLESVRAAGGTTVGVNPEGQVDLDDLKRALGAEPAPAAAPPTPAAPPGSARGSAPTPASLVSVMTANNETGVVQPLDRVIGITRRKAPAALVHTDAVQAVNWLDPAAATAGADLVSISAHKFGGPQGVGALVVRNAADLDVTVHGGGQEAGRRSGTHNVAGIAGLAAALAVVQEDREALVKRVGDLRDRLADGLLASVPGAVETGRREDKVAGICHLCIPGVESEALVFLLDQAGVCASAGSACASGATQVSHVLRAMGVPEELARGALRLSLGWTTTEEDVDAALEAVPAAVARLRSSAAAVPAVRAPSPARSAR
ncbi:MAG TPA: cysteine desulfurase family protein [Acidimicrobiales bacterium]|nr:cysteine desulfurase family protein [Acidimicrobiales bacterium]